MLEATVFFGPFPFVGSLLVERTATSWGLSHDKRGWCWEPSASSEVSDRGLDHTRTFKCGGNSQYQVFAPRRTDDLHADRQVRVRAPHRHGAHRQADA